MKPIRLVFNGLRSYLTEQTIDFTLRNLMAVVGPTGAGKSSLLEGIYFALFGTSTWSGGTNKDLIAEGGSGTLAVEFTFQAQHKTWTIARSVSRNDRPAPVVRLTCHEDGTTIINGSEVKKKIESLTGLDRKTFLKASMLPQGRTQELLHMGRAERAEALKRLLGVDQLDKIREHARDRHRLLQPKLDKLIAERDLLLPDPQQALADATRRHTALTENLTQLQVARTEITAHHQARQQDADAHQSLTAAIALTPQHGQDLIQKHADLAKIEQDLDARRCELTAGLQQLEDAYSATHAEAGPDADAIYDLLVQAITSLAAIGQRQHDLDELTGQLTRDRTSVNCDEQALGELTATSAGLHLHAEQLHSAQTLAAAGLALRQGHHQQHTLKLAELRHTQRAARDLEQQHLSAEQNEAKLREVAITQEATSQQASEQATVAEETVQQLQRQHAAAHAAQTSRPGDPCPICIRPLPEDFRSPDSPDLDTAQKHAKNLAARARKMSAAAATATANATAAETTVTDLGQRCGTEQATFRTLTEAISDQFGPINLTDSDTVILAVSAAAVAEATTRNLDAVAAHTSAHGQSAAADAQTTAAAMALKKRTSQLAKDTKRHGVLQQQIQEGLASLPDSYRPDLPTTERITTLRQKAEADRVTADKHRQQQRQQQEAIAAQHQKLQNLSRTIHEQVIKPATVLYGGTVSLASRCTDLAKLIGDQHTPPATPSDATVAGQIRWATTVVEQMARLTAAATEHAKSLADRQHIHDTRIAEALQRVAIHDADIHNTIIAATVTQNLAQHDIDQASTQIPFAADLDHRIKTCTPHVQGFEQLVKLLSDGQLIGAIVEKRQRTLLGAATSLLRQMTRQQFAYAADFQIFDAHTGQIRGPLTLSGGETFIASLALALAVVDVAGAGAGRAEALFLDEGFGSLDSESLGQALDALSQQVLSGRFVCLISHMRQVAEHVSDVLLATKPAAGGSQLRWLTDAERQELANGGNYGGLLW